MITRESESNSHIISFIALRELSIIIIIMSRWAKKRSTMNYNKISFRESINIFISFEKLECKWKQKTPNKYLNEQAI